MPSIERFCLTCGKQFFTYPSVIKIGKGTFCSQACNAIESTRKRRPQYGENNPNWKGGEPTPYREAKRKYRKNHPQKARAHMLVRDAIKNGVLCKMPCEECGKNNAHAHHDDYDKPLVVVWLCKKHHENRHVLLRSCGIGLYVNHKADTID
jgi:hypothetical protein